MSTPVEALANALLNISADEDEADMLEAVEALRSLLQQQDYEELCEALEVCPIHACDEEICRDDENEECAGLRILP